MAATHKATGNFPLNHLSGGSVIPPIRQRARFLAASISLSLLMCGGAWAAEAAAPTKPDPAKAQKIATEVCSACHGADGNTGTPAYPRIAGQHPEYLYKQLMNFKGQDGKPAERANPIMGGMVAALSEADMMNLAAFYAGQKFKPSVAKVKETAALGQQIFRGGIAAKSVPACSGCHGPNGAGMPAQYPHLSGQNAEYTYTQLTEFRDGKRMNSPQMKSIAEGLSEGEMKAVADYIAGLR